MPNRIIKETITTSCEIDHLSADEERFFYRLMVSCDDFGRMDARTAVLRAKCFPLKVDSIKNADIEKWLRKLIKLNLITLYEADGKPYLFMTKWDKHQQRRAKNSKYPAPDEGMISDDINGNHLQEHVPEESRNRGTEESRSEDKRKNFTPPSITEITAYCKERNNDVDAERFHDFYQAKGWMLGKNKMSDWKAAVRTWEKKDRAEPDKPSIYDRLTRYIFRAK